MMTFDEKTNLYWLVTASNFRHTIQTTGALEGAAPVFDNSFSNELMPLSPWLIPIETLNPALQNELTQGIILASKTEFNGVMAHLRSLLWAYLEGEKVLFRFYDPVVIMPMLAVMSDGDRSQFLGNISHWLHWQGEEYTRYENHSPLAFTLQTNPWWRVKSEHLTAKEDHTTLATNIERALWRVLPTAINKLANPKQFIEKALQQFPSMYATSVDRQIYVLAHLIKAEIVNINDVVDVLHLSLTEREQLEYVIGALK
ncbi:DUF4123 domain-containing protein [Vibrio sp. TRT 29B02]|uniref:DUF4123 domain-containing protein n=1 Tax=Vibrio sp. TRT 29B02 TaxID=3418508 RepID=UPI003CF47063